jgi:hypothetical protein
MGIVVTKGSFDAVASAPPPPLDSVRGDSVLGATAVAAGSPVAPETGAAGAGAPPDEGACSFADPHAMPANATHASANTRTSFRISPLPTADC